MMIKNYKNFILGIFIFLIPFLGLPLSFKFFIVGFCGLLLSIFSISLSKKENSTSLVSEVYENKKDSNYDFSSSPIDQIKDIIKKPRKPRVKKVADIPVYTDINPESKDFENDNNL